jgi:hypothetical protein
MPDPASTTRWRNDPIIPTDYEDLESLVKLARQARTRIVEFDWAFGRDELVQFQRAMFELGSAVTGRYKCFKARILVAIRNALGDPLTAFVLNEPKSSIGIDCAAFCAAEGNGFRLQGHATFDLVFGCGAVGLGTSRGSEYLAETVKERLLGTVGTLGWDIRRLHDERFRGVCNALYGSPVGSGLAVGPEAPTQPPLEVHANFRGPFSAAGDNSSKCLFTDPIAHAKGVYLWTILVDGHEQPWYVGQTARRFGSRIAEHLRSTMSGEYQTYDIDKLLQGEYVLAAEGIDAPWPQRLSAVLRNYRVINDHVERLIRVSRFHVAELDPKVLNRVEGALGRYFRGRHSAPPIRLFFMPGLKVPARIPHDRPLRLTVSTDVPIAGFGGEIPDGD